MNNEAINPELLSETLDTLLERNIIDRNSVISLHNWGEPSLHPDLSGIIQVINSFQLLYVISTNASVELRLAENMAQNLQRLTISMPGFSQRSYTRVNKLDFEVIKKNIIRIVENFRKLHFKGGIVLSYHLYKFNLNEMQACEKFAEEQNIVFEPCYAIINDWFLLQGWLNHALPLGEMQKIYEDIFTFNIRKTMKKAPRDYLCPQHDYLVIDEKANVITCCQLPKNQQEFLCGNILRDPIDTILVNKKNCPVCKECINSGLAYYLNNSLKISPHSSLKIAIASLRRIFKTF